MQNENVKMSLEGSIPKAILKLSVPILLANLLQSAYQLIDAFWVWRLGGNAVAAVSVSFPVTILTISLGVGFAIAGSTLIAQYVGAKNEKMVNHVAAQTLLMVLVVSVVLGAVWYGIAPMILRAMWVETVVYDGALAFMRISFVGLTFVFGFFMFQSIMRGIGQVKMPLYIVLCTVLLNFVLDPFFIFGYGPVPAMGVSGAALATLFTQGIAGIWGLVLLFGGKYGIHLKLQDFKPDYAFIKRSFFLGFPSSVEMSARGLGMVVLTFLIASFGTVAMAGYGAGGNILQVIMIPGMGLSMATSVLIGQNMGAKNVKRAEEIGKVGMLISFALLTLFGVIAFFAAPWLIGFFVPGDQAVIEAGAHFLRIASLTFGFIGVQLSVAATFRASGNMMNTLVLSLVAQWILQFPIAYVLSKHTELGVSWLWYSFPISNIIIAVVSILWFLQGGWKKKSLTDEDQLVKKVSEEVIIEEGR